MKMLPQLYQTHLENQLEEAELLLLTLLINVLQDIKEVSLEKIANALPLPILFESRRKKLQRFLSRPTLTLENLWLPLIRNWLTQNFSPEQTVYLVIDRTKWERTNLLMISLIHDQRAIPIYFETLEKLGNSDYPTQARVLSQVLPLFNKKATGNREQGTVRNELFLVPF